ncbi:MAG: hypothetical protein ACLFM0_10635, partial [Spirochaetales bacterium]
MAENQEKDEKKPKATLIKHRKGDSAATRSSSEEGQKRKTKIVVKRKSKPQHTGGDQGSDPREQSGKAASESSKPVSRDEPVRETHETSGSAEPEQSRSTHPVSSEATSAESLPPDSGDSPRSPDSGHAATGEAPKEGEQEASKEAPTGSQASSDSGSSTGDGRTQAGDNRTPAGEAATEAPTGAEKGSSEGDTRSGKENARSGHGESAGQGDTRTKRTFRRQPARPSPAPYRRTGSTGKHVSTSELEARAEKAETRPSPSPGRGPSSGGERRGSGPSGGGPRPFPPKSGGAPPPPGPGQQKGAQRKFFKSKKKEQPRGKDKREKTPEKEIHYKQKRSQNRTNPVPKEIEIMEAVSVADLAKKMNLKASDI